jgi:hypothetical protein
MNGTMGAAVVQFTPGSTMKQLRIAFAATLTVLVLILPSVQRASAGEKETVEVEGYASIVGGHKDTAREKAINNALRRAVEEVVGVMVESQTLVRDFQLLNDRVYSQSSGYIQGYSVIGEKWDVDSCSVKLRATVSLVKLEQGLDSLGVLAKQMGKPRIVMFLAEQNVDQSVPSCWWRGDNGVGGPAENALTNKLLEKGFEIVDRQVVLAGIRQSGDSPVAGANMSNELAMKLMAGGEAEVVIIGRAHARQGAALAGTTIRSYQATVTARAVNADTGDLLGSAAGNAVAAHVNPAAGGAEALKKAADEAACQLVRQITASWQKAVHGTRTVKLVVAGLTFADVASLKAMLKERLNRVDGIYERSFSDGTVKLDLDVKTDAREIAANLDNLRFKDGFLKVTAVTANVIRLTITRG